MSRVDDVERLLQVLSVLRAAEGYPVPWSTLKAKVGRYASSDADPESVKRMMNNDLRAMAAQGFQIVNVAPEGSEAAFVLREGEWRLPVELDPAQRAMLVWAMASGSGSGDSGVLPANLTSLLGASPDGLDIVQAALAGCRAVMVEKDGEEVEFAPGLLASRLGRWFVLGRYAGDEVVKGPRLDRLGVLRLGEVLAEPVPVGDPDLILDPTAWNYHEAREAVVCCAPGDLGVVQSWFPRSGEAAQEEGFMTLRFSYQNEKALVSRVIGLGGLAWIAGPASAVQSLCNQVSAVVA